MPQTTVRISRERKELLSKYAEAAVLLYGMLSIEEFVEVFNHYETDCNTTVEETTLALLRFAKTDDVEYSLKNNLLTAPAFQPSFYEYKDDVENIRAAQKGKPRYIPDKEEFLQYLEVDYREPEKPWTDLKAYILKHNLTDRGEGLDGVDGDLMDLHEFIQENLLSAGQEIGFFTERGYKFKDINEANAFVQLVMNAHNNTRLYENNGFTPMEIFEKFERPKLIPLPKEPFVFPTKEEPSRNSTCPCGSGKKYKRCCGK